MLVLLLVLIFLIKFETGTWPKTSKILGPRKPFSKDNFLFEYEIDSADEWEEGGEGESLIDSEKEEEADISGNLSDDENVSISLIGRSFFHIL